MTPRQAGLFAVIVATTAALGWTQSQAPGSISTRRPAGAKAAAKMVKPDPDLLDGSIYDAEPRPLYGMISEIELPGSEEKSERVGGAPQQAGGQQENSAQRPGPAGGSSQAQQQPEQPQAAAAPPPIQSGQDDRQEPQAGGPQAQAQGVQAASLQGQQSAGGPQEQSKPRDMQIGDATLQIQTVPQNQPQVVGTEQPTSTQQYEKKVPPGQQTDNRNRGVEKGKVMPKGI